MVPLLVILTIVVFVVVDIATRLAIRSYQDSKRRKQRQEALDIGLRLEYTDEAPSLKRVTVEDPKARILAVDDEAIVLDSFRKILVLAGYSIDTVETGQEANGLVRKQDYDFVFTDLKMPDMDGLDVTKAVKHFRPDIDVVMITGFATIESAVDAMKYGAMDYVQKPFTAEELVDFVDKLVIRREDRIRQLVKPHAHLVTPSVRATSLAHEFNVPSGIFIAESHTWIGIQPNGMLLVGVDDFATKLLGEIDAVRLPDVDRRIEKGNPLFALSQNDEEMTFSSPAGGTVSFVNERLLARPELVHDSPYEDGWICGIDPSNLPDDLQTFKIGAAAIAWYEEEIDHFADILQELTKQEEGSRNGKKNLKWQAFSRTVRALDNAPDSITSLEEEKRTS